MAPKRAVVYVLGTKPDGTPDILHWMRDLGDVTAMDNAEKLE